MQTLIEDKVKQSSLGEVAYNQAHGESQFLEESIALVELELIDLKKDKSAIFKQLAKMRKDGGMSFWLKPILYPDRPIDDGTSMIII
jgi:hypothetical protein